MTESGRHSDDNILHVDSQFTTNFFLSWIVLIKYDVILILSKDNPSNDILLLDPSSSCIFQIRTEWPYSDIAFTIVNKSITYIIEVVAPWQIRWSPLWNSLQRLLQVVGLEGEVRACFLTIHLIVAHTNRSTWLRDKGDSLLARACDCLILIAVLWGPLAAQVELVVGRTREAHQIRCASLSVWIVRYRIQTAQVGRTVILLLIQICILVLIAILTIIVIPQEGVGIVLRVRTSIHRIEISFLDTCLVCILHIASIATQPVFVALLA